jgi:ATP-dependent RNA helicase DDX56/DBP9
VVDEADLVLSFGYADDVAEIVRTGIPKICQGFLMSATLTPQLNALKKIVLHSPVILKLEEADEGSKRKGPQLKQFYLPVPNNDRYLVLYVFLKLGLLRGKGLFFVSSTDAAYRFKLFLEQFHIRSAVLNPELPFRSRLSIIDEYNVGNFDYLIATDDNADTHDSGNESETEDQVATEVRQSKGKRRKRDNEYGVSRGLDFQHVSFVVNVDFPSSARSYAHRVGRTARGRSCGVALTLLALGNADQQEILSQIQSQQPLIPVADAATESLHSAVDAPSERALVPAQMQYQPTLLDFDLREIEGFRYRVEDVSRAVTKVAIREARAEELRAEILNSERLQNHFDENPADLQLLRHDRIATHVAKVHEHLKHVPKYLLPQGMQVANLNKKRKRKKAKKGGTVGARRSDNDPLRALDQPNEDGEDPLAEFLNDDDDDEEETQIKKNKPNEQSNKKVFANTRDGTGRSTAGRNEWKAKHRKGQFSAKPRSSEKRKTRYGI